MKLLKYMAVTFAAAVVASVLICRKAFAKDFAEVGIAPPYEPAPECEELDLVMERDLQDHVWKIACGRFPEDRKKTEEYYAALIGLADGEGEFNPKAYNGKNKNDSVDRGMWQINSRNIDTLKKEGLINDAEDLYNPVKCANCADFMYWPHYKKYGFSRRSYDGYLYNDGKAHDNYYTVRVWEIQQEWFKTIWG